MSLFKTKEWWRTGCGTNEFFHKNSLLVTPLLGPEVKDVIIVGSDSGYLRIYSPSSRWSDDNKCTTTYKSTDLIIEMKLSDGIIEMKTGKFVSGSSEPHLAVLTAKKLTVYNVNLTRGSTEYGDRCMLNEVYEHLLSSTPVSLTTGPFGGVEGREFFCIQYFDGTLQFFEQEAYMFSRILSDNLLPSIILYNWKNDFLVISNSNWILECYRYSNIAESGRKNDKNGKEIPKELKPDLVYNIGECITDMNFVAVNSFEVILFVLGTRNMFCFNGNNLTLMNMKKLDYCPLCCWTYVTEPDGQLMIAVVVDTNTLLIYEGTTLKWSAQFSFTPVSIARAHTQYLEGIIVILSHDGLLEACYLGSEPSVFAEPRIFNRTLNNKYSSYEVNEYQELIKQKETYESTLSDAAIKTELIVSVNVLQINDVKQKNRNVIGKIAIQLSSYVTLFNIQVCIEMPNPLTASEVEYKIPNLCQKHVKEVILQLNDDLVPKSLQYNVIATYIDKDDNFRFVHKKCQVPINLLIKSCSPENVASLNVIIKSGGPSLHTNQIFPDFIGETTEKHMANSLGLQHINDAQVVTVVMGLMSNRYRVQSNSGIAMSLIVQQIINKLLEKATDRHYVTVNHNHIQLLADQMESRFEIRQRIHRIKGELDLVMNQLREIEKRMLRAMVEKNVKSLSSAELSLLLETSNTTFLKLIDDLSKAQEELETTTHNLYCLRNLVLCLSQLNLKKETFIQLQSAIGFEPTFYDEVDWEEITDFLLTKLLNKHFKKLSNHGKTILPSFKSKEDFNRMKQNLTFAFEKLSTEEKMSEVTEDAADSLS